MRSRAAFVLLFMFCLFTDGPAWADKRVALVIGNSAYQNVGRLTNPANDASAVAEMFRAARFEVVESKRDLNNTEMRRVLRDFTDKAWEFFIQQYPAGFYANLARVQLDKIAAEEGQRSATDKARQAEAEKARLAAEGAKAAEQARAAREAKAAEDARIAAEKQRQAEQAKAEAAERARAAAEQAAAEKQAKEKAEAEAKAIRERAQAEAKAIREKAEADAKAAEDARKAAEKEAERLKLAALEHARSDEPADKPAQVAALPADASKTTLTPQALSRSLQTELRRVGCQTGAAGDEWTRGPRRMIDCHRSSNAAQCI